MRIRPEVPGDYPAIHRVEAAAFGRSAEAELVDRLRAEGALTLSLVAEEGGGSGDDLAAVVGHIAFSPLRLDGRPTCPTWLGLAPVAVLPDRQGEGVGGALIRAGLGACRAAGAPVVALLGHPAYYPRFGFRPAHELGLRYGADVPPEAFMALELVPGAIASALAASPADAPGELAYAPAFAGVD